MLLELLKAAIAAYGLSTLMAGYDGPFRIFFRLRKSRLGTLFDCNTCLVPYLALIPVLGLHMGFMDYLVIVGAGVILSRHV